MHYRHISYLVQFILLFSLYFITARFGLMFGAVSGFATLVWPPTGIALSFLILLGIRFWPAIFGAAFMVNLMAGAPLTAAIGMATGNTLEALIGSLLLKKYGFSPRLERLGDVLHLILFAAILSTSVSAFLGVTSLWFSQVIQLQGYGITWRAWWMGDALGNLIIAPLIMVWASSSWPKFSFSRIFEGFCLGAGLVITVLLVFGPFSWTIDQKLPLAYTVFPFIIWSALRFGQMGTVTTVFFISCISLWHTTLGQGPFSTGTLSESLTRLQFFQGITAITAIIMAAVVTEREHAMTKMLLAKQEADKFLHIKEENEARLQRIIKGINDGVFEWNPLTGIAFFSSRWKELLGYRENELPDRWEMYFKLIHPDDRSLAESALREHFEKNKRYNVELRRICKNGEIKWFRSRADTTRDSSGRPIFLSGAITDITERKQFESELQRSNQNLKTAVHARDEMIGIISHELKNPLTALQTGLVLIQRMLPQGTGDQSARELANKLMPAIHRMNRLISDLLEVTKLEANALRLTTRTCSLYPIVQEVIHAQFALSIEKRVQIKSNIQSDLEVLCDSDRIAQVLINLLNNALKFTSPGGLISIDTQKIGSMVEIKVTDSGKGISKEHLPHVFDRFWQAKDTAHQGTGLGLAIAKGLVEAQGGIIWAESEIGVGTTFHFTLPVAKTQNLSLPEKAAS